MMAVLRGLLGRFAAAGALILALAALVAAIFRKGEVSGATAAKASQAELDRRILKEYADARQAVDRLSDPAVDAELRRDWPGSGGARS